jgi:putative nucleotidyltransferase with HDIG domain
MERAARAIVERLRAAGHDALWAGGCVRDHLRGVAAKDIDIATSARPEHVGALFPRAESVGAHFGVMLVREGGHTFEIATFRADGEYADGRRPESVRFTTAEEDAQRRDFTVNGLFFDPMADRVIDFVGGLKDLESKTLRAIGDPRARFAEDHLRLMRAARFATVLGFEIEPQTWVAIGELAPKLSVIAVERVREEWVKMMRHPQRVRGFDVLDASGLLRTFLPEAEVMKGCEQPPEFHPEGDVFVHTRLVLSHVPDEASLALALSAVLHDIGKPATRTWDPEAGRARFNEHDKVGAVMTEGILRRMKFDTETIDAVVSGVAYHMHFMHVQQMRVAKLKRFMARPFFEDEMWLHRADCLGSHGQLDNYDFLRAKEVEFASEPLIPPRLVTGHELMALGIQPGPQIGRWIEEIQSRQLEGSLRDGVEALAWVREVLRAEASP